MTAETEIFICVECGADAPWDGDPAHPAVCEQGCEGEVY